MRGKNIQEKELNDFIERRFHSHPRIEQNLDMGPHVVVDEMEYFEARSRLRQMLIQMQAKSDNVKSFGTELSEILGDIQTEDGAVVVQACMSLILDTLKKEGYNVSPFEQAFDITYREEEEELPCLEQPVVTNVVVVEEIIEANLLVFS